MTPPCERSVPGYGSVNADFHVVGLHPGVHGGIEAGIPFTGKPWSRAFFTALERAELVDEITWSTTGGGTADGSMHPSDVDTPSGDATEIVDLVAYRTFFSYLHMCLPREDGVDNVQSSDGSDDTDYTAMESYFDAELRAIAAHVLLPVGRRATEHLLSTYTAVPDDDPLDMDERHGTEIRGSGWLIVPIKSPSEWAAGDADRLVAGLETLQSTDFRREADLGRFLAGGDPYFVR